MTSDTDRSPITEPTDISSVRVAETETETYISSNSPSTPRLGTLRETPQRGLAKPSLQMSEADWSSRVADYARLKGWRLVHIRNIKDHTGRWRVPYEGDGGLPDWILARNGVVLLVELKARAGRLTPQQKLWLAAAGGNGYVWSPAQWSDVLAVLA